MIAASPSELALQLQNVEHDESQGDLAVAMQFPLAGERELRKVGEGDVLLRDGARGPV